MKLRLLLLALAVAIVPVSLPAADAPKPPAAKPERPETELEKTMSKMGKAWREVRKAARAGQLTPATATLVATVRTNAEAAAKLTPMLEKEKPAAEQAKFHAAYLAQLKKLTASLDKLEARGRGDGRDEVRSPGLPEARRGLSRRSKTEPDVGRDR